MHVEMPNQATDSSADWYIGHMTAAYRHTLRVRTWAMLAIMKASSGSMEVLLISSRVLREYFSSNGPRWLVAI